MGDIAVVLRVDNRNSRDLCDLSPKELQEAILFLGEVVGEEELRFDAFYMRV